MLQDKINTHKYQRNCAASCSIVNTSKIIDEYRQLEQNNDVKKSGIKTLYKNDNYASDIESSNGPPLPCSGRAPLVEARNFYLT